MPSDLLGAHLDKWTDGVESDFLCVQRLLSEFSYKPGWLFELKRTPEAGGALLHVQLHVPDSRRPRYSGYEYMQCEQCGSVVSGDRPVGLIPVTGSFAISCYEMASMRRADNFFLAVMLRCVNHVEDHERDEWFRFRGQMVNDPHKGDG